MYINAKNPQWTNKKHQQIVLDVQFEENGEYLNFVAAPDDVTEYGPVLFEKAKAGEFGPVEDSLEERILRGEIPLPPNCKIVDGEIVSLAAKEREAQEILDQKLAALSTIEMMARAEVDDEYAAERRDKIRALLAVKEQAGWPLEVVWPEEK